MKTYRCSEDRCDWLAKNGFPSRSMVFLWFDMWCYENGVKPNRQELIWWLKNEATDIVRKIWEADFYEQRDYINTK